MILQSESNHDVVQEDAVVPNRQYDNRGDGYLVPAGKRRNSVDRKPSASKVQQPPVQKRYRRRSTDLSFRERPDAGYEGRLERDVLKFRCGQCPQLCPLCNSKQGNRCHQPPSAEFGTILS